MPSSLQGMRAGAASERLLCTGMEERACRGAGRSQELCVCKLYEEVLLLMGLSLPNVSHVPGFSKNPEKVGEDLLGSSWERE